MTNTVEMSFAKLIEHVLGLLTDKEKMVIMRRYAIGQPHKDTLDKIGMEYNITRERVRQVQDVALRKLLRLASEPNMARIHDIAHKTIMAEGGILFEEHLLSLMVKQIATGKEKIDLNALKLALQVSDKISKQDKHPQFKPFWTTKDVSMVEMRELAKRITEYMKKMELTPQTLESIQEELGMQYDTKKIEKILYIMPEVIYVDGGWTLRTNRMLNPKSIKDKIITTLKTKGEPMHFSEIIRLVMENFPMIRSVTPQAVHNELIRHQDFNLVGRGMYGLADWDLASGTVCDVIIQTILDNGEPMKRQDIIDAVMDKRPVRSGTISLNLQKHPFFVRTGRAVYSYDPKKDMRRRNKYKPELQPPMPKFTIDREME